jgi:carbon monoxide dehydrogenase subunit G
VIIDQEVTIPARIEDVWDFMMDVPAVSQCVPNVERFEQTAPNVYDGTVGVKVGPISVHLEGRITLGEQDRETWTARLDGEATDRRIRGAVSTKAWMRLTPRADGQTDMSVHADASILGKLGQFGQAVLRKKADQIMAEFVRNMSAALAQRGATGPTGAGERSA